jgi:hypothetical protein
MPTAAAANTQPAWSPNAPIARGSFHCARIDASESASSAVTATNTSAPPPSAQPLRRA